MHIWMISAAWLAAAAMSGYPIPSHEAAGLLMANAADASAANTARDGDIATREEFDAAVASGDPEKLKLFIARNPDHPLADKARAELDKLDCGKAGK